MKMLDVISAVGERMDWIKIDSSWEIDDGGQIILKVPEVCLDDEVDVVYYWYDHLMPDEKRKKIQKAINNHDFKTFKKYEEEYEGCGMTYFPSSAFIYKGDEAIGSVCVVWSEDTFSLINFSESECG